MLTFSVILNTYNQVKYFPHIFDALQKQTYSNFEVIVTDDGGDDAADKWINEHPQYFPVTYVRQRHQGMRLARLMNLGIKKAQGEFIVHVMADSVPDEKLLKQYNQVMTDGVVGCGLRVFCKDAKNVEEIKKKDNFIEDDWRKNMLPNIGMSDKPWGMFTGNNLCISKCDYERIHERYGFYWNPEYEGYGLEDFELAVCLWEQHCEFVPCMNALVYHISHAKPAESENNQLLFWKKMEYLKQKYGIT